MLIAGLLVFPLVSRQSGVYFFDVGQGDSALIKTPNNKIILIDGGPDNSVLFELGKALSFYRRRIDFIIVSHYHDDHIAGLIEILNRYKVKKIIYPADSPSSEISESLLSGARTRNVPIFFLSQSAVLRFTDDCNLLVLSPLILDVPFDDNNSLIAKLDCRQKSFLFTGDSNTKVEKAMLSLNQDWRADVFKASHHGSVTANSEPFLRAVNPQLLIISVGADNRFGHPHPSILERAANLGIELKRTDQDGTVIIQID